MHDPRALQRALLLSRHGRAFFFVTWLAHAFLKLLLGLYLVREDGYGVNSLVAPPSCLIFAAGDALVCYAVARLSDLIAAPRRMRAHAVLAVALIVFLLANFIVHTYFKAWLNRGLFAFNGAGYIELMDYARAGFTGYAFTFLAFSLALVGFFIIRHEHVAGLSLVRAPLVAPMFATACGVLFAYATTFSAGQSGWLIPNPAYSLVRSYVRSQAESKRASAEELEHFQDPRTAIYGTYETKLDFDVPAPKRPNVLFVMIESLPFEQTSLGGTAGGLPILRELADNGVSFTNFHTVFPATSRSFITYHCGIYPTSGAATVTKYLPGYRCESVVEAARSQGYRTGFFTAPMFTYDNLHKSQILAGYDRYEDFLSLHATARKNAVDAPAVEEETVVAALLSFLTEDRTRPFFATYFMFWNHAPYRLPFEDISSLPPLERYKRTLVYLDATLRELLWKMRGDGLLDNTIVVVTADHGEGFALHHENTNHVGHIYEDELHIPFVIQIPGMKEGHTTARQATNVDFAPTLARLLGLRPKPSWQGQDMLAPVIEERPSLYFGRAAFSSDGLRDGQFKLIRYQGEPAMLFDLRTDPDEQHDLAADHREQVRRYTQLVDTWLPVVEARALLVHESQALAGQLSPGRRQITAR